MKPHVEKHFTAGNFVRDVVIGMSDGLTVPFALAAALWQLLVYAGFIGTVYVLLGVVSSTARPTRVALALIVGATLAAYQPVRASTYVGQADCILLLLLALTVSDFAGGRELRSGLWLALAASIKPTLAFLLLFFLCGLIRRMVVGLRQNVI